MAFPRALSLVKSTSQLAAEIPATADLPTDVVHVREGTSILDAIARDFGGHVQRSTALRVPAFARAYKLYTHTIACFPLREYSAGERIDTRAFLQNPSQVTTYTSLIARTVGDLICEDVAYWRITSRDFAGKPRTAEHMPYDQVTLPAGDEDFPTGTVRWRNAIVPASQVVRFDGDGTGGWLRVGVDAINTAAALEAAVLRAANVPMPGVVLKNSGPDLPADQVDALLEAWEESRANRSTAYLNSTIEADGVDGWSPNELQQTEARNAAAAMIARLANLDPIWCGAGVPGSSLVYANRVDLRKDLVDMALRPVMGFITDRLSQDDITEHGHSVMFDSDLFLRANTDTLADVVSKLVPLEVLTAEQAATLLDLGV